VFELHRKGDAVGQAKTALEELLPLVNNSRSAKELMGAFPRTIQFELDGEQKPIYMVIAQQQMAMAETISGEADIVATGDGAELARVIRGEIDITHLIARGTLFIKKGKISEMTLLNRILWSVKRR
jgi:putative sterol carrier protein